MHHTQEDLKAAAEAQYSQNLRKAVGKVKRIIKSKGLAASVILYEPGFSEYLAIIDPIFSAVQFGEKPGELKIMDSLDQHYGSEQIRKERLEATMNMLVHLANMSRLMFQNFNNMATQVEKRAKVFGDKTSHQAGQEDKEKATGQKQDPAPQEVKQTEHTRDNFIDALVDLLLMDPEAEIKDPEAEKNQMKQHLRELAEQKGGTKHAIVLAMELLHGVTTPEK